MQVQQPKTFKTTSDPTKHAISNRVLHLRDLQAPLLLTISSRGRRRRLCRRRHNAASPCSATTLTRPRRLRLWRRRHVSPSLGPTTCFADFDATPYGSEYLRLTQGDVIQDVKPTMAAEVGHTVAGCLPTAAFLIRDGTPTHMLSESFAARRSELQVTVICSTGCEQRRPQGRSRASSSSNFVLTLDGIQDAFQQQLACCSCARTCLPAMV